MIDLYIVIYIWYLAKSIYKYKEIITYIHPCTHVCVALTFEYLETFRKVFNK